MHVSFLSVTLTEARKKAIKAKDTSDLSSAEDYYTKHKQSRQRINQDSKYKKKIKKVNAAILSPPRMSDDEGNIVFKLFCRN